jgi:antitoxin VapB
MPLAGNRESAEVKDKLEGTALIKHRRVKLLRDGRNQAVRIPIEFELPDGEAIMHRDGNRLVIEPILKRGLLALLKTMKPVDEPFPKIDDPVSSPKTNR